MLIFLVSVVGAIVETKAHLDKRRGSNTLFYFLRLLLQTVTALQKNIETEIFVGW